MNEGQVLIDKFFEENNVVNSDIASFNNFLDVELQNIVEENKIIEPTIIPHNVDEMQIRLEKIWVEKPEIIEADGSKRPIYPIEARLRKITYAAPVYLEVSSHINGVQRESFTTQIGNIPIMLKSKNCHLSSLSHEELIQKGEDPDDPGGYFIINGTEKVIISVEDLAWNNFVVDKKAGNFVGKVFSEKGQYRIPHQIEKTKEGLYTLTFTRMRNVPIVAILKALGMVKDEDIMKHVAGDKQFDDFLLNLYEFASLKTEEDALDYISKKIGSTQPKEQRIERLQEILDRYLLPHISSGMSLTEEEMAQDRMPKALNLCKLLRRYILTTKGITSVDDIDHYKNKRVKLAGDLLGDLFRANLKVLIGDLLYNFQRIVKRGKFPSIKVIIREKLLTSRIYSAMATGNWVGGRKGISQRIERLNFLQTMSHLQRVVSPLSSSQENFKAREAHPTHFGRLCPIETPEGTNIGLRKNMSILAQVTNQEEDHQLVPTLKTLGLKEISN